MATEPLLARRDHQVGDRGAGQGDRGGGEGGEMHAVQERVLGGVGEGEVAEAVRDREAAAERVAQVCAAPSGSALTA